MAEMGKAANETDLGIRSRLGHVKRRGSEFTRGQDGDTHLEIISVHVVLNVPTRTG